VAKRESRNKYKRRVLIEEITRRVELLRNSEVDTEFAAIENGLEVRIRFIPETFVSTAQRSASEGESPVDGADPKRSQP
jgi:hypothetical protein